jgi:alkylation response protein AidB-like acyl-CoA dehydrogenase
MAQDRRVVSVPLGEKPMAANDTGELAAYRDTVKRFIAEEITPFHQQWEKDRIVPRELWRKAGAVGLLCPNLPEEYGGGGADFRFSTIVMEEMARAGASGPAFGLHSDIVVPYIQHYGSVEQKRHWLPKMARGETITAIAMTEPGAGSDLAGVMTRAVRDGDDYVINGQKTFISNGQLADLVIVVAKTDPTRGAKGVSLILVEGERPGFKRGRNLEKVGMHAQDTSELFFDAVRVPASNLLGGEGQGFACLMNQLPQERLTIAIGAIGACEAAIEQTLAYVRDRKAFGQPLSVLQHVRFDLTELYTEVSIGRVFLDHCITLHLEKKLDSATASMAKYWLSELQFKVLDHCVQLHGGYGYMSEYPVARAWADARVQRIYGGTTEIMKEIISRKLFERR